MPMKKFTLILFSALLGLLILSAQKNNTMFDKNASEAAYQQKDNSSDNIAPKFTVSGKTLHVVNMENGTIIEIYSALGAKVQTITFNGNPISLVNLNKGVYIVRSGKFTQKIML